MTTGPLTITRVLSLAVLASLAPATEGCGTENKLTPAGDVDEEETEEEPPLDADWGQWLGSTVLSDGSPGVSYYDRDHGGIGFAVGTVSGDTVTWSHEHVDGYADSSGLDAGNRGQYTSVVTASDGTVWAAYHDIGAKNLRWGKRDPVLRAWVNGIADVGDGLTQYAGLFASITIGADGFPVIVHHDKGVGTLRMARHNGTNFAGKVIDSGEPFIPADTGTDEEERASNTGHFARIRVFDGVEYIAYYDAANRDLKLAVGGTSGFEIHTVDADGDVGQWPDFTFFDGRLHIAYQDFGNQTLKYAIGTPEEGWTFRIVDDAPYVGSDTSLYFDGTKPRVVYFDGQNNDMKIARFDGGDWTSVTLASAGAKGFHNEVIPVGDRFFVACYDYTSRNVYFAPID